MTTLSQISLGRSQAARLRLADSYAWHQALWRAFPEKSSREFLFRVDDTARGFRAMLLSATEPNPPEWGDWQSKPVPESFLQHHVYQFQVKANPTMRRNSDRRRLGIYGEDTLREWFARKAVQAGFSTMERTLALGAPTDEWFSRGGKQGKHVAVDFSGVLEVVDAARFQAAFSNGIGSAKAFGFGLLMLQPVK